MTKAPEDLTTLSDNSLFAADQGPLAHHRVKAPANWMKHRIEREEAPRHILPLIVLEDFMHYAISLVLVGLSTAVLWRSVHELIFGHAQFWDRILGGINDLLFVVIILEIFRTVLAHFHESGFQLKPFLVIGIISAVRHILTVGAQLTLKSASLSAGMFDRSVMELGVSALLVIALVGALVLIRHSDIREGGINETRGATAESRTP